MRFDVCLTTNQATGSSVPSAPVFKRRVVLLLPLPPLSLPLLSSAPSPVSTSVDTIIPRNQDKDDAALKRSITALDKNSPFDDERTPTTHSTAFQNSQRVRRCHRPILFMLYLLALLLEMSGRHGAVACPERASTLSTKSIDNSERGVADEHPYNEYTWELNQLNPWLSACDLAGPAPADLQGSCGPPEVPKNCPSPCKILHGRKKHLSLFDDVIKSLGYIGNLTAERQETQRKKTISSGAKKVTIAPEQCLFYLEESHKRDVCRKDFGRASSWSFMSSKENRYWFMTGVRLRHCCEHAAVNALAPGKGGPFEAILNGGDNCIKAIEKLLLVDALAARLHCEFEEVLARYDCGQSYSVIHNCTHCKEAYRKWVCSSLVPYFAHGGPLNFEPSEESWIGRRLRPCRSLCQSVEQRCPYLLPGDRAPAYPTQYAGEPTFLCRDPNIPETGEQASKALHPNTEDECCFKICSEEKPALGICANCTNRVPYLDLKYHNLAVAPECEITTSMSSQQQLQPIRRQLSLCGNGGIGSMITNENSFFIDQSTSLLSELSSETSLPITTSTVRTSASSAASITSSTIFLCLLWFQDILSYSQYFLHHIVGAIDLAQYYFQLLCATYTWIMQLFLIKLFPILNCSQLYYYYKFSCNHKYRHATLLFSTLFKFSTTSLLMMDNITIVERYLHRQKHCYYSYYRWWLWPCRWKNYFLIYRFNSEILYNVIRHCYYQYYWYGLPPTR